MTANKKRYQVMGDRKQMDGYRHLEQYKELKSTFLIGLLIYAAEIQKCLNLEVPGNPKGISIGNILENRSDWKALGKPLRPQVPFSLPHCPEAATIAKEGQKTGLGLNLNNLDLRHQASGR